MPHMEFGIDAYIDNDSSDSSEVKEVVKVINEASPLDTQNEADRETLLQKLIQVSEALQNEREIRMELEEAKRALACEVEELSQALFEEAGSMVAKEARARAELEHGNKRLQVELGEYRERLEDQTAQLEELKARMQSMSFSALPSMISSPVLNSMDGVVSVGTVFPNLLSQKGRTLSYYEELFPEQKFNSRRRCANTPSWSTVIESLADPSYQKFCTFVERCSALHNQQNAPSNHGKSNAGDVLSLPFMKECIESDIAPCLTFSLKPHSFTKRVVAGMMANECVIERLATGRDPSEGLVNIQDLKKDINADAESGENNTSSLPSSSAIKAVFTQISLSVTSLPDTIMSSMGAGSSATTAASQPVAASNVESPAVSLPVSPSKKQPNKESALAPKHECMLCGACPADGPRWRLRLNAKDHWRIIDQPCRDRLVAVGDYCTFLRHLRGGYHANRPLIDLYFDHLHHLRNMFYVRTASLPFFMHSDFDLIWRRLRVAKVGMMGGAADSGAASEASSRPTSPPPSLASSENGQ